MLVLSSFVLATAQGIVESGLNPWAVGKAKERGAWQVIERHHGKVPLSILGQFKQYNGIMSALTREHGTVEKAIIRYNGAGPGARKYCRKVQTKALEITLLGV